MTLLRHRWLLEAILSIVLALVLWSLFYAQLLSVLYKDPALLNRLVASDPLISLKQAFFYWQNPVVQRVAGLAALGSLAAVGLLIAAVRMRQTGDVFGDSRFMTGLEARGKGFRAKSGVILGRIGRDLLRVEDDKHVLVVGPTRSGKGVGFVIPNALSWRGSLIVLDIKRENHTLTAAHRRDCLRNAVFLFSPGSARSHRYNPLDFVRSQPGERATDLQKIAEFMVPRGTTGTPMWQNEAKALLVGLLSYVLESELYRGRRRIGEVLRLLRTQEDTAIVLNRVLEREPYLPRLARDSLAAFINKAEKERSGVRSELTSALKIWANPLIDAATSGSDFDLRQLRRKPISIYIGVQLTELAVVRPLLSLLVQQAADAMTRAEPGRDEPHKVLFLLDEFPALGRMEPIVETMPVVAGYGMKLAIVVQGLAQLDHLYEESGRNVLLANAAHQLVLAANDHATATFVSEALGRRTIRYKTESRQHQHWGGLPRVTRQEHVKERSLMMPEEVRRMDPNRFVLLTETERPIFGTKLRYFETAPFKAQADAARQAVPDVPELALTPDLAPPAEHASVSEDTDAFQPEPQRREARSLVPHAPKAPSETTPAAGKGARPAQPLAAEDKDDIADDEPVQVHQEFPQPEKAFELFETALEEVVGRTREAILADKTAPAQVVRDNLADLADIQAQCRIIGEAEIESGDKLPEINGVSCDAAPEVGRPAEQGLKKRSRGKKREAKGDKTQPAAVGRELNVVRQRRPSQRSTSRP